MIVDAHLHIWKRVHGLIGGGKVPVRSLGNGMIRMGGERVLGMPACHLDGSAPAEWAVATFDAAGVDVGVVVQEFLDGEQNQYLCAVRKKFSDRFFLHALPNWHRPDMVAKEAARLFARGFRGLKLPGLHVAPGFRMDDPRFTPIWEHMEANDYVFAVDLAAGETQVPQMEAILKRHPKLRVAIGHFGMVTRGNWLSQIRLARYENVYVETGGIIWLFRREGYPFRGAIKAIQRAKREVGIEKLMWGSDWPRTMVDFTYRQALEFVRQEKNGLTPHEKKRLLGENAARLYRLARPAVSREPVPLITEG